MKKNDARCHRCRHRQRVVDARLSPRTLPCHPKNRKPDRSRAAKHPDRRCTTRCRTLLLSMTTEHHLILCSASTTSPPRRPPVPGRCPETRRPRPTGRAHHEATRYSPQANHLPVAPKAWPTPSTKQQQAPPTKEAAIPASSGDRSAENPPDLAKKNRREDHLLHLPETLPPARPEPLRTTSRPAPRSADAATQLRGRRPGFRICCVGDAARGPRDPSGREARRHRGAG
jgi:hypothetical protein